MKNLFQTKALINKLHQKCFKFKISDCLFSDNLVAFTAQCFRRENTGDTSPKDTTLECHHKVSNLKLLVRPIFVLL